MSSEPDPPAMAAISLWAGVACPNAAGRRSLDDFAALIQEFEALQGSMAFEDEPSAFEYALRAEAETGA